MMVAEEDPLPNLAFASPCAAPGRVVGYGGKGIGGGKGLGYGGKGGGGGGDGGGDGGCGGDGGDGRVIARSVPRATGASGHAAVVLAKTMIHKTRAPIKKEVSFW